MAKFKIVFDDELKQFHHEQAIKIMCDIKKVMQKHGLDLDGSVEADLKEDIMVQIHLNDEKSWDVPF